MEPQYQSLEYYTQKARTMPDATLRHAIRDVVDTLDCWKGHAETSYTRKLMAEFDAYTVEQSKRLRGGRVPQPRLYGGRVRVA
jgi:hypothetical protein